MKITRTIEIDEGNGKHRYFTEVEIKTATVDMGFSTKSCGSAQEADDFMTEKMSNFCGAINNAGKIFVENKEKMRKEETK